MFALFRNKTLLYSKRKLERQGLLRSRYEISSFFCLFYYGSLCRFQETANVLPTVSWKWRLPDNQPTKCRYEISSFFPASFVTAPNAIMIRAFLRLSLNEGLIDGYKSRSGSAWIPEGPIFSLRLSVLWGK